MGGIGSKHGGSDHPSSTVHLRDKKDLAGVGIIFRKGPDGKRILFDESAHQISLQAPQ